MKRSEDKDKRERKKEREGGGGKSERERENPSNLSILRTGNVFDLKRTVLTI